MVPKTLAAAIRKWPSADLAELLGLITGELHKRADHVGKGNGIEAELKARSKKQAADGGKGRVSKTAR